MLQDMTDLLVNVSSRRDVMALLYLETAETNLIYALGKYIQASSSRSGANITVSSRSLTDKSLEYIYLLTQHSNLSSNLS